MSLQKPEFFLEYPWCAQELKIFRKIVNQPGIFLGCKIGRAILPRPFLTQTRYCSYRFCFAGSLAKGLNSLLDWPDVLFSKFSAKKALSCSSLSVLTSSGSFFISEKKAFSNYTAMSRINRSFAPV